MGIEGAPFRWTEEACARLRLMRAQGIGFLNIAVELGCTRYAAREQAIRLGLSQNVRWIGAGGRFAWTDEATARLRKLWADGWTSKKIAADIGAPTRNVVIGKVHRLGLSNGHRPHNRPPPETKRKRPLPPRYELPPTERAGGRGHGRGGGVADKIVRTRKSNFSGARVKQLREPIIVCDAPDEPASLEIGLLDLNERTCKWPHGDGPFTFCGHTTFDSPYCPHHAARARSKPVSRTLSELEVARRLRLKFGPRVAA